MNDYQTRLRSTLVIRKLIYAIFIVLFSGLFAVPAQAQSEKLSIDSVQVTDANPAKKHFVEISGTYTSQAPKSNTRLDLVTYGPIQTRSELAKILAEPHTNIGTAHPEISVLIPNPTNTKSNSWTIKFDGSKALGSPNDGVYVFGLIKRGSTLQTNYVQPWFYQSNQIAKTKIVFLAQLSVQNNHLADGSTNSINQDALSLARLNNLLDDGATGVQFVKDNGIDSWLADLAGTALEPAAAQVTEKFKQLSSSQPTQVFNHTDLQSLFVSSPADVGAILRLSGFRQDKSLLYFPKYGQINALTLSQLNNFGNIIPVLSNTFINGAANTTANAAAKVNGVDSLIYDAATSRCLSTKNLLRSQECISANTAMITAESPYQSRTVAILAPPFWSAQSSELSALSKSLNKSAWATFITLNKAQTQDKSAYFITGQPKKFPTGLVIRGKQLTRSASVLGDAVSSEDFISGYENSRLRSFSELYPKAQSAKYFVRRNQELLESIRTKISIQSSARITIANATTEIPLTVSNKSGFPIKVKVVLASGSTSRFSASPSALTIVKNKQRVTVPVKIHLSGTGNVKVTVQLQNSKGQDLGITQEIVVASSSYQSLARTLVWGACGLLVLFAIVNAARKRRGTDENSTSKK